MAHAARSAAVHPRLVLNISASPFWCGKPLLRRNMLSALARRHNAIVAMVNQVGGNDSLVFDGSSIVIAPNGEVVAQAASFREDLIVFDTDDLQPMETKLAPTEATSVSVSNPGAGDTADTWKALVLGTRDYVRKCGFRRCWWDLSGGIDSALVAAIAAEALGAENVVGVAMPGPYCSDRRDDDARAAGRQSRHPLRAGRHHGVLRKSAHAGAGVRRRAARRHRREHPVAHARRAADGAVEQVRRAGADHRQQERDGGRLLHALRRHGGRAGGDRRPGEDAGLRDLPLAQPRTAR